jgi:uncharacterized protein YpuA (DUF1002 family)
MTYQLSWYIPDQVISLVLEGQPTIEELHHINHEVVDLLNHQSRQVNILIDAVKLKTGYQTVAQLRDTQKYMDHAHLNWAYVVADTKLNRLITLLAFSVSRAYFMQFDSFHKAELHLKRRLTIN